MASTNQNRTQARSGEPYRDRPRSHRRFESRPKPAPDASRGCADKSQALAHHVLVAEELAKIEAEEHLNAPLGE